MEMSILKNMHDFKFCTPVRLLFNLILVIEWTVFGIEVEQNRLFNAVNKIEPSRA